MPSMSSGSEATTKLTRQAVNDFLELHGIEHAEKVVLEIDGYTVHTFRRDKDGKYMASQDHPGEPIRDVEVFVYGN